MGAIIDFIKDMLLTTDDHIALNSMNNASLEPDNEENSVCSITYELLKLQLGYELVVEVYNKTEEDYMLRGLNVQAYSNYNTVLAVVIDDVLILPKETKIVLRKKMALKPSKLHITFQDVTQKFELW